MSDQSKPKTVVIFSGLNGKMAGATRESAIRTMAEHGRAVVWLTDRTRSIYLNGCDGYETQPELVKFLRRVKANSSEVIMTGWSAGGMGAAKYGCLIDADAVVTYAPFLSRDQASMQIDTRGGKIMPNIRKAEPNQARRSVEWFFEKTGYDKPVHQYFAAHNPMDAYQASIIAHRPNVHQHPVEAKNHRFLTDLKMEFHDHWALVEQDLAATWLRD